MKKFSYALLVLVFSFAAFAVVSNISNPDTVLASSHSKPVHEQEIVVNDNHDESKTDDSKDNSSDDIAVVTTDDTVNNTNVTAVVTTDTSTTDDDTNKNTEDTADNSSSAVHMFSVVAPVTTATINATKIVCDNESDLPNWGAGGPDITSSTASQYVIDHPTCHIENWTFEWAPDGTSNPGDQTDVAGGVWTAFSGSTTVPSGASVWVREEFKDGYIPFSGWLSNGQNTPTTADKDSAELYCNNDVLNYDNYDFVNPIVAGHTYNCIGFNVSTTPPVVDVCPNIDGVQAAIPTGDEINKDGNCVPIPVTVDNTCPVPDTLGDSTTENVNITGDNGEQTLQTILDNANYSLDVQTDQKQFQVWNVTGGAKIDINAKFINEFAHNNQVFGYYVNGDTSNFVPVFKTANVVGYDSTPLSSAGPFTITVPTGATTLGFAIKTYDGDTFSNTMATQNSLNPNSKDQVVVYNPSSDNYVLAFEDINGGDNDFNDLVVEVDLGCETTPPPVENTCPAPDAVGDTTEETVNTVNNGEESLQTILDNANYSLDVQTDQKQFQAWNIAANSEVTIDTSFISRYASYNSVFGYYTDGDMTNFVPVFKTADITGYDSTPLSSAGPFTISTGSSASTIGFAIKVFDNTSNVQTGTIATLNSLNTNSDDQVVAYNPTSNEYLLAFEDVIGGDYDYNDLVVKITLGCSPIGHQNAAPIANAGIDQTITLPTNSVTLDGSGSNDSDGTISSYVWDYVSGPSTVNPDDTVSPSITGLVEGTYVFQLTVTDNDGATGTDTVSITVKPASNGGGGNAAPIANAGIDQIITLPTDSTNLDGSASSDSDGTIASYVWTPVSGPSTIDPADTVSPSLTGLIEGTYVFQLTVTDNDGATGTDTVTITVDPIVVGSNPECSDGVDNDNDNLVDASDPGCHTDGNPNNPNSYNPNDNDETDVINHGGGTTTSGSRPVGQVLAAENTCGIYVDKYLRVGYSNNSVTVEKVQTFLNNYMNAGLTVDGIYGVQTEAAVRNFQVAHADKVLSPWGIDHQSTGIFYLTTQTEVNNIMCPTLNLPIPANLINFSQNSNVLNTPIHTQTVAIKGPIDTSSTGVNI